MANVALDENLLKEAIRLGKHRSRKEAAAAALETYVQDQQRRQTMLDLVGKVDFWPKFDHKDLRRGRNRKTSGSHRG